jgi:hypothetical protein
MVLKKISWNGVSLIITNHEITIQMIMLSTQNIMIEITFEQMFH